MKTKFQTQDREAGNAIEQFDTYAEAAAAIAAYEATDKAESNYTADFYEIAEVEMDIDELLTEAHQAGFTLETMTTTTGANGYPENLNSKHLRGFDSFEEARSFVQIFGGEIHLYKKRAGHHFWEDRGAAWQPLTADDYVHDLGDNYAICGNADEEYDYWADRTEELIKSGDIEGAIAFLRDCNELKIEIEAADDDQTVVRTGNQYVETVDNEMMRYFDANSVEWQIGVNMN